VGEFRGFGKDALGFFRALKFHQNKAWFDENRPLYEEHVVAPLTLLLADLTAAFARKKIPLRADGKKSIFRIYRDVRFSKDKSPYKTHAGAVMTRSGQKDDPGLLYIHIDPQGCFVAAGFHIPDPAALTRLRQAIARGNGNAFLKIDAGLRKAKLAVGHGEPMTRMPRGFETLKGGPLDEVIRRKSLIVEKPLPDQLILMPRLRAELVAFAERALPLLKFGWNALE
jgi:uncharacterized protein (TIGR02453 family)